MSETHFSPFMLSHPMHWDYIITRVHSIIRESTQSWDYGSVMHTVFSVESFLPPLALKEK